MDSEDSGSDVAIFENSIVSVDKSKDPILLEKVGEVLANLHILLIKKALKGLKNKQTCCILTMKGGLVSRRYGAATYSYEMPLLNTEYFKDDAIPNMDLATINIQSNIDVLSPQVLCTLLQKLINS